MLNSIIYRLKQDKFLFVLAIVLFIVAMFDITVVVFDIVNLIITRTNPAKLASGFLTFNIIAASVNVLSIVAIVVYIIVRKR